MVAEFQLRGGVLRVPVTVLDSRRVYGREEVLVQPKDGEGQVWIRAERLCYSVSAC